MSKVLRLGFVLGGGVSLGSFSAAALSESLKQQILFAQYATQERTSAGQPVYKRYDIVEVDVFSGASAGAMSLAVMLRCLVNSRDKFRFLGFDSYERMRERMEQQLLIQFGEEAYKLKQANSPKWESLVAVQIMQEVQARLWTDEVNIDKLLGVGAHAKKLDDTGSFLDRTVVDELARRCFQFGQLGDRVTHRVHVLGQRVLFACTLANLSYTQQSPTLSSVVAMSGDAGAKSRFSAALNDAATDKVHSEVRVFDFNFMPINPEQARYYPLKWVQYHQAEDLIVEQQDSAGRSYGKMIRNLDKNEVWREVAATAVASGAFPLAFEPVVLNRYQHEYGEDWAQELRHLTKFPFTYVDGGVFNNEPIGEALRLAAFLDSAPEARRTDFDRQIIFIDPNVGNSERQLASNVHGKLSLNRSLLSKKSSIGKKSALMRMMTKVPHLLAAILNEARTADAAHISQTDEQFAWRESQRAVLRLLYPLAHSVEGAGLSLSDEQIIAQRQSVAAQLDRVRAELDFPSNTLQIQHELLRIAYEERTHLSTVLSFSDGDAPLLDSLNRFVYSPSPSRENGAAAWLRCLSMLALDISLRLIGQRQGMTLVPIAPFDFYRNDYRLLSLPGGGLAGFAGFASAKASAYEVRYGQYCANRMLLEMGLIAPSAPLLPLPNAFDYSAFDSQLKRNLQSALHKRIKELIPSGIASTAMAFIDGFVQDQIHEFVEEHLYPTHARRSFELRIRIGKELFSLRGFATDGSDSARNRLDAVRVDAHYYLLTQLNYDAESKTWTGGNVEPHTQRLHIDKIGLFSNSAALTLSLPLVSEEMMRSPNPIFILDASVETSWGTGAHLDKDRWFFYSEAAPLDEALWGDDKLRQLAEKM